jgi:hypothetical protein
VSHYISQQNQDHQSSTLTQELFAGYKEYKTDRKYMARMGDWRNNKDFEIPLDGIGGVNILVKADVHRSGKPKSSPLPISSVNG